MAEIVVFREKEFLYVYGEDERDNAKSEPMPGGALNMEDVEEHVEALFDCMERVRRKYAKWIQK